MAFMQTMQNLKVQGKEILFPIAGLCLAGYFAFHLIQGDRGIKAYHQKIQEKELLETRYNNVNQDYEQLKRRVEKMNRNSLDLDLVDERARDLLGYAGPNDLVIYEK